MHGAQMDRVLDLIDANLEMNRDEVLHYIEQNEEHVAEQLLRNDQVDIPTSAGTVTIKRKDIAA